MSEEKLYIDDGELVYYINENEFIACDEIPMPMLEEIKHLQQKVEVKNERIKEEQQEKERYIKFYNGLNIWNKDLQQKVEQLENIRKEAITYILANCEIIRHKKENVDEVGNVNGADLLNILNKGSDE